MHKKPGTKCILPVMIWLLLLSVAIQPLTAAAESSGDSSSLYGTVYQSDATGYEVVIEDDAGLLSESEKSALLNDMKPVTAYGNVAFKTIDSNHTSTSGYTRSYYDTKFGYDSGIVLCIDMDNREIYLFSDGAIYRTITKSIATIITDNVYSYASGEDYYTCASTAFSQVYAKLEGQRIAQPMKYITNTLLALLIASIANYFFVKAYSRARKPTDRQLLDSIYAHCQVTDTRANLRNKTRTYSPRSSDSGGSHHSGGGGGGGHSGGGGGGHRF